METHAIKLSFFSSGPPDRPATARHVSYNTMSPPGVSCQNEREHTTRSRLQRIKDKHVKGSPRLNTKSPQWAVPEICSSLTLSGTLFVRFQNQETSTPALSSSPPSLPRSPHSSNLMPKPVFSASDFSQRHKKQSFSFRSNYFISILKSASTVDERKLCLSFSLLSPLFSLCTVPTDQKECSRT